MLMLFCSSSPVLCNSTVDQFQCSSDEICKKYFCESGLFQADYFLLTDFLFPLQFIVHEFFNKLCSMRCFQLRRVVLKMIVRTSQELYAYLTTARLTNVLSMVNVFMGRFALKTKNVPVSGGPILIDSLIVNLLAYGRFIGQKIMIFSDVG